ncbi:MAG: hypothetical protein ACYCW6_03555 [Candidatus Xenobia bacterium]
MKPADWGGALLSQGLQGTQQLIEQLLQAPTRLRGEWPALTDLR